MFNTLSLKLGKDQVAEYNFKQRYIGWDNLMLSLFIFFPFSESPFLTPSSEVASTTQW